MILDEFYKMKQLLDSFLGEPKTDLNESYQLEYPCPRCIEKYGNNEIRKYNCSVSLKIQKFHCWKCSDEGEPMKGSILKLIKLYGNESILKEYKELLFSLKDNAFYQRFLSENGFSGNTIDTSVCKIEELKIPNNYHSLKKHTYESERALKYLSKRGVDARIIDEFNIGFTSYDENNKIASNRIILPSYDKFGELNYWTGRDFTENDKRQKYFNPKVERKDIIFNEEKIEWDADITLVEGPFDHIVVPNSIPLLGKSLTPDYKLYWEILKNANANINIFLDADAIESVRKIYGLLNHGRLYNKIRYVPVNEDLDPSKIFEIGGRKLIVKYLHNTKKIKEEYL